MDPSSKRIIVVTGASRGIGKAIALSLASPQTFVYINYNSREDEAEKVVSEIKSKGGNAKAIQFNVGDSAQVSKAFEQIEKEQDGVDVLVANAGITSDSLLLRLKDEELKKVIDVNLGGTILTTRAVLKTMLKRKNNGRIVFITSVVGQMGNTGQSVYTAAKAGIVGFMRSIAKEVASRQITVNAVAPGFVKTDMTSRLTEDKKEEFFKHIPLGRFAEPEDIANVVKFLVSEKASYITGQELAVNGGMYM